MPDISGFTNFVNETEVEHSIHIIAELLEILLDHNPIGFELVEIEGDALFMYTEELPNFEDLIAQITSMLEAFHQHIYRYNHLRICDCGACRTAVDLNLKFILHHGDLHFIKVKQFKKPYGKDVIRTHRLLKNRVKLSEYLLMTESVQAIYQQDVHKGWLSDSDTYDHEQALSYFYKNLAEVKQNLLYQDVSVADTIQEAQAPAFELQEVFATPATNLHALISDWQKRTSWDKHIKRIEYDRTPLNQIGARHTCILEHQELDFVTIPHKTVTGLAYGEATDQLRFIKKYAFVMHFDELSPQTTRLRLKVHLQFSRIGQWLKPLLMRRLRKRWEENLQQLKQIFNQGVTQEATSP